MDNRLNSVGPLLQAVKQVKFKLRVGLQPKNWERCLIPENSTLCIEGATQFGKVVVTETNARVVNANGDDIGGGIGFFKFWGAYLKYHDDGLETFNIYTKAILLWIIPIHIKVNSEPIPVDIDDLIQWASTFVQAQASDVTPNTDKPDKSEDEKPRTIEFDASFFLEPDSNLALNDMVKLSVSSEQDSMAEISIKGNPGYIEALVIGKNVSLETDRFTTGSSDIDAKFSIDLPSKHDAGQEEQNRFHFISIQSAVLRDVQFNISGTEVPKLGALRLSASDGEAGEKTYDFVITIDATNPFTFNDLLRVLMERVNDPATVRRLQNKLKEGASNVSTDEPFELKIDSTRWSIVDYATHDLRKQLKLIIQTPHIRADYVNLGIAEHVKKSQAHFLSFLTAFHMQHASKYDLNSLSELVRRALSADTLNDLYVADETVADKLLTAMGVSADDGRNLRSASPSKEVIDNVVSSLNDSSVPATIAPALVSAGNVLNTYERRILREIWIAAGALKRSGRLYVMMIQFAEELRKRVLADERASKTVKQMVAGIPTGEALQNQVLRGADNIGGIIWVGENVLPDGWGVVSERLEKFVINNFGDGTIVEKIGAKVFNTQASKASDEESFKQVRMRYVADGEEFFQQLYKLLEDTQTAMTEIETKGCVAANYWSFEAYTDEDSGPNKWALRVAGKLEEMALEGFTVSIVVNGQNSAAYRGEERFAEITQNVEQHGKGRFLVHEWMPADSHFPLGTHVKYTITPLGVVCGGSNISDHYAHWLDTNILLSDRDSIERFAKHHERILAEQNEIHSSLPIIERIEPLDSELEWEPLQTYKYHGHEKATFQSQWETVGMRVFRDQGGDENDRILVEHIAALDSARPGHTVYIIQCYYVTPQPFDAHPVARAIMRALERGVNVEIITNSTHSIDVEQTAGPVLKACFLTMKHARRLGDNAGTFTVHLPSAEYVSRNEHDVPEVLVHDKLMFFENIALVGTHNFHPRSFTMEQELLTEVIGPEHPDQEFEYERLLFTATTRLNELVGQKGGNRAGSVEELMTPLMWKDEEPPILWGPAAYAYIQFLEKKWLYCDSYSSKSVEDTKKVEEMLDISASATLLDLAMNVF